ncbi:MAG: insulinase family protein [Nitrospinae bacterium]|nr:insulinase family protein [Nitrospinota bacterium]
MLRESKYQKDILTNGIRVITENIPYVRSVSIGVWLNTGSRDEDEHNNGISHFLEHLAFKGTKKRTFRQIAFEIDSIGGQLDAFTSREYTCYSVKILDEHLPHALDILSDILLNSTFESNEIEKERGVIIEEIKMFEDMPSDYIYDILYKTIWPDHPFGQPIQGESNIINKITRDNILTHLDLHYIPKETIIAGGGNVIHKKLVKLSEKYFNSYHRDGNSIRRPITPQMTQKVVFKEKDLEQVHLCLGTKGLINSDSERFKSYLLNTILGGSISSRLFQKIREEKGLAYSIYSFTSSYIDTGIFGIYAGMSPKNLFTVIELIMGEIRLIKNKEVEINELKKSKNQLKGIMMLALESSTSRMNQLAKQELYLGRHLTINETISEIEKVTPSDIQDMANRLFDNKFFNLAVTGPLLEKEISLDMMRC